MVRSLPLAGEIPTVTADWQWHGEWPITTEAVMTGAWRLPKENKVVLLFANVSDASFASRVEFAPEDYVLSDGSLTVTTIGPDGAKGTRRIQATDQPEVELAA